MVLEESSEKAGLWSVWRKNAFVASFFEVAFAVLVSNFAIFIAIFVSLLISKEQATNLFVVTAATFQQSVKTTEIVVYILGFLAPALWIMVGNIRAWRHVGLLVVLIAVQLLVILSTSLIYALSIAEVLENQGFANSWAWSSLLVALIVWYLTLVYDKRVLKNLERRIERPKPGRESGAGVLAALRGGHK